MRTTPIIIISLICYLVILLSSCKEVVQSEFPDIEKTPVVNSILQADSTLVINLSYSASLNFGKIEYIENATIRFFVDDNLEEIISNGEDGMYISNITVTSGKKYNCEIDIPGYKMISCEAIIPIRAKIINITHKNFAYTDPEGTIYPAVELTFENNIYTTKYFEVVIKALRTNWEGEEDNIYAYLVGIDDPLIINEGLPIAVFSNELITDSIYTMSLNYFTGGSSWNIADTYPYIVELHSINYDYYKYLKQLYLFKQAVNSDNLTGSTPPVQIYSNVENGYGIFAGYSNFISDTIFPENSQTY
ncbi:MAG: DUF4249 domain-containing protein [Bacteroidales bacterium]|nr:DUF4249 domain-containing protein [Bacteroidales bacterium]